jgi:predicted nucleic acid-binding protein
MTRKIYLDTSVIGGIFDDEFSIYSKKLFKEFELGLYSPVISQLTKQELEGAPIHVKEFFEEYESSFELIETTAEALKLSAYYMFEGNLNLKQKVDSLHIATATVNRIDILASWNFKHIVNLNKIVLFNAVNMKNGFPTIEIRNPRELIHE